MGRLLLRKWLLVSVGIVALGLGVIGVFVPLLPTTPFLLLAAACFMRSSDRLYRWLIGHKWLGGYIKHYRENRAITLRAKVVVLITLWAVIGYSALGVVSSWWLRALLMIIALGVTIHLLRLRTLTQEMAAKLESAAARE